MTKRRVITEQVKSDQRKSSSDTGKAPVLQRFFSLSSRAQREIWYANRKGMTSKIKRTIRAETHCPQRLSAFFLISYPDGIKGESVLN
jgi:hypothetical protein